MAKRDELRNDTSEFVSGNGAVTAALDAPAQDLNTGAGETIEALAKAQGISRSVLAAVQELKHWAGGKKVSESEFKKAVADFLGAPARGGK